MTSVAPEGASLTDEEWKMVEPLTSRRNPLRDVSVQRISARCWAGSSVGNENRLLLAGDARGGVRQMDNRLPTLRAVGKAGLLAAYPRSVRRGRIARTAKTKEG
jgi:hypothetical protein